ncbi:MAG: hypothetical protein QM766_29145 [Burkholderiaceae bacterium]
MTAKGFIFLMLVTIGTVMVAGTVAESFTGEGFGRTIVVAVLTALVVFPAARWAERKGWIKGSVRVDELRKEFSRQRPPAKTGQPDAPSTPPGKPASTDERDGTT